MNYAINHPKKIKSLILIAPQYKMPYISLKIQNLLFYFMPEATFKKLGVAKTDIIQLTNSMLNLNFGASLHMIACPTLIVCGSKDYANKRAAKFMAHYLLGASAYFIEGTGHEVNVEVPKELAKVLNAFYNKQLY